MAVRDSTFDILKGLGIILVFIAHTSVKDVSPFILSFHMPLFFIVSGYFYKPRPFIVQLKTDFRRLLIPFFFISIVTKFLVFPQDVYVGHSVIHPDSPAWFLLALFFAKLMYKVIYILFHRCKLLLSLILSSIPCFAFYWYDVPRAIVIFSSCFCAVLFIAIGDSVRRNNILSYLEHNRSISLFVAILLWLNTSVFGKVDLHLCIFKLWIVDFAGACAGTYLCYEISRFFFKNTSIPTFCLSKLGYYSLVVYSFHSIEYVFPSWFRICAIVNCSSLLSILIVRFFLCCLVSWIAMKIPCFRQLYYLNVKYK